MHFEDLNSFVDMGGYGLYVWLSFGAGALSLSILWLDSLLSKKTLLKRVVTEQARQARIKAAAKPDNTGEQR